MLSYMFSLRASKVSTDGEKINELLSRGVSEVIEKDALKKALLSGEQLRVKLGIDPTSPHLHLGRSVLLLKLRDFQKLGHKIVLIIGDFTGVIGDTSDKDSERPMLSPEVIQENLKTYTAQAGKILDMDEVEVRHNSEWLKDISYEELGRQADQFSLAEFIARDNIRRRLDDGKRVSLRELLYPLMQGYDSVAVKADVELGGTDQRFNLLAGRSLQALYEQKPQHILTTNLIEGLDGRKMSSSWGNTINLSDTAEDMFGKVMRLHDELIETYFIHTTRVPLTKVSEIMDEDPRVSKEKLALAVVSLYHGEDAAEKAKELFTNTFSRGEMPMDVPEISRKEGESVKEVLLRSGSVSSGKELERLLTEGAVSLEGEKIKNIQEEARFGVYKIGKRRFLRVN